MSESIDFDMAPEPSVKRPRRTTSATIDVADSATAPAKRGPGRPRKTAQPEGDQAAAPVKRGPGRPRKASSPEAEEGGTESAPVKRGPGRPRKTALPDPSAPDAAAGGTAGEASEAASAKRGPGRPRKSALPAEAGDAGERPRRRTHARIEGVTEGPASASASSADGSATSDEAGRTRRDESRGSSRNGSAPASRNGFRKDFNGRSGQQSRNNQKQGRHGGNRRNEREMAPSVTREELSELKVADLRARATELGLDGAGVKKAELVELVFEATARAEGFREVSGVLDVLSDGYGFLRTSGYLPGEGDCYVGTALIKRNHLRKGDFLVGQTRPARPNDKFPALQRIDTVNGIALDQLGSRPRFADLTPIYPSERLVMEHGAATYTSRVIDLVAPIGKGQRGLIVSPPKAGKTSVLKDIAASISANNPEVHLMCLLVDERPEEVTDMQRSIKGEVISSTFDMPADNHIAVAEMVIERAKRMVECGADVVILLDSITRLARAYNLAQPASGRVLSGGVDSTALYPPKRFLGAARNIEHGGSLTILASALVDTGSKMDEVIFEEFKGTGNMELRLDRALADRRVFPAIDPVTSGTRKEDLLMDAQVAPLVWAVRRILANMNSTERAMDTLIKSLKQTDTNEEFLLRTARKAQQSKGEGMSL
ncbi:transcription termination factor Rho [Eggerthellaceae bacterium zg-1084]|uniref:transcription termination factor Rho n=1 Tax=Berryella wangjianweii TaxID=2734634 RepID=UPI001557CB5C|nr:transcription termination factor Rho [Berryella wangjianweii]NPD31616.1 transcription termination factor Rho [Berryella wangjianweii]